MVPLGRCFINPAFSFVLVGDFVMLKALIPVRAVVSVVVLPSVASANSNDPLTHEQVLAEFVHLQRAGYNPGSVTSTTRPMSSSPD